MQSAIGGARLLMRQKLKLFADLGDMAEKQSGPAKATAEDLQVIKLIQFSQIMIETEPEQFLPPPKLNKTKVVGSSSIFDFLGCNYLLFCCLDVENCC